MPRRSACDFTKVTAACALSFMTSPSWPVRMSLPLPRTRLDSMNRMSPPAGVQARPVATPGTLVRSATSFSKRGAPRMPSNVAASIDTCVARPEAIDTAALRSSAPICRSRLRTPASRV